MNDFTSVRPAYVAATPADDASSPANDRMKQAGLANRMRKMRIGALARQDLVADDQRADTRNYRQFAAASASGNWVSICCIIEPKARSISGSASTRRAWSARKRSANSSAVIDSAFCPCLLVKR